MPATPGPDYEMQPTVDVATPEQLKAIGDDTRRTILSLLAERAATTSHLAEALQRPRGSVGHHLKVLERAGLVRVVRRRKVRALTEKYYGRTGRTFLVKGAYGGGPLAMLEEAMRDFDPPSDEQEGGAMFTIRHARIPVARADEFMVRVQSLAEEFAALEPDGDRTFGFVAGVYSSRRPALRPTREGT